MFTFIRNLFNDDKKMLKEVEAKALEIDALKDATRALTDDELKAKTQEFKDRLANGATLDDLLVEAYAVAREASYRVIGEFPYVVQLMGGIILHQGDIAEMKTGEGKTLTAVMPVYLNALSGKGVHVVTVNEYLAQRDASWMGQIHNFLGLTVGCNVRSMAPSDKREAYLCDITYSTNSELGFDYLRDNMVMTPANKVQRPLNFALIDEVDSILIDEARTPLIISGAPRQTANLYINADRFVKSLDESDYEIDEKTRQISLLDSGTEKAEKFFRIKNLYDYEHTQLVHTIKNALKANYIMAVDVEYVVREDAVVIVDQFTGRMMEGRQFSDGLHQALEAKEGVKIKEETATMATITYQNYFRLYSKLAGMTGTAKTEEEEFLKTYNMRVLEVPTNRPVARDDRVDKIYASQKAKYKAIVDEVERVHATGQPILLGTVSVETSELLDKMLTSRKIKHEVLNAKNHKREADIIAQAGQIGAVTIATNMAGRGTDIKLGEGVKELGGLMVIGSERHESRRIDNQLRGRSGRQGDPGVSQFFVSTKDDLMVRFGTDRMGMFDMLGDEAIVSKSLSKSITSAQKRVEGQNFDIRKQLLEFDDVLRQQRETMYALRDDILYDQDVHQIIKGMFERVVRQTVEANTSLDNKDNPVLDLDGLAKSIQKLGFKDMTYNYQDLKGLDNSSVVDRLTEATFASYDKKIDVYRDQVYPIERRVVLSIVDQNWMDHIDIMDRLRNGIHLRSYAQGNPLQAYVEEGYELFEDMVFSIAQQVVQFCLNVQIRFEDQEPEEEVTEVKEEPKPKIASGQINRTVKKRKKRK